MVSEGIRFVQFTTGVFATCAVDASAVACRCGKNWDGQLGVGDDRSEVAEPVRVANPLRG